MAAVLKGVMGVGHAQFLALIDVRMPGGDQRADV